MSRRNARVITLADLPPRYQQQAVDKLVKQRPTTAKPDPVSTRRLCGHESCDPTAGCTLPRRYRLVLPGRAPTTNSVLSSLFIRDPGARMARTAEMGRRYKEWKDAAFALAVSERIPTVRWALFEVQAVYRSRLPDAGGLTLAGKAMLDGLVAAGVFVDDNASHVLGEWYPAPVCSPDGDHVLVTVHVVDHAGHSAINSISSRVRDANVGPT